MTGYHIIPHEISQWHIKTIHKYLSKKASIADIWIDICNDFQMKNNVSYNYYSKRWNWHRREIKKLFNHIGIDIPSAKNQYYLTKIKLINPLKSNDFPENCFGIFIKIFGQPNGQALDNQMEQQKTKKTNSYQEIGQPNGQALDNQMDNNKIKEYNIRNNRIDNNNIYVDSSQKLTKKESTVDYFEIFWKKYRKFLKENPLLSVNLDSKKKAREYFNKLKKIKLSEQQILSYTDKYLFKCKVLKNKVKAPFRFLRELQDTGFRQDIEEFDPYMYLNFDDLELYFDFDYENGSKGRIIFKYKGVELNKDQIMAVLINKYKTKDKALEIMNEFRTFVINCYDYSGIVEAKWMFKEYLKERRNRWA